MLGFVEIGGFRSYKIDFYEAAIIGKSFSSFAGGFAFWADAVLCPASIRTLVQPFAWALVHVGVLRSEGAAIYSATSTKPLPTSSGGIWRFSAVTRNTASAHLPISFPRVKSSATEESHTAVRRPRPSPTTCAAAPPASWQPRSRPASCCSFHLCRPVPNPIAVFGCPRPAVREYTGRLAPAIFATSYCRLC